MQAALIGLAQGARSRRTRSPATGTLDVLRYGRVLQAAAAGRRARRRARLRRPLLRQERHAQHQARRVQAELLADAQRPDLDSRRGCRHERRQSKFYGKYRGTVVNNVDPMQMRPHSGASCPTCSGSMPSSWAMPCVPLAGMQMGVFAVPPIGAGVWVEFEQGDPDYPIWTGCFWGIAGRGAGAGARRPAGRARASSLQTPLQNAHRRSATCPGPTGGIMLKSATGATHHRQRHRHLHPERQGRVDRR